MVLSLGYESALWDAGARVVVGIDEVGRGALAGPVSVGLVAVSRCDSWPDGLADSKQLTARAREALIAPLSAFGVGRTVGHASAAEIDQLGIIGALRLAGVRGLAALAGEGIVADAVLLDGTHDWLTTPPADLFSTAADDVVTPPVTMVVKGDGLCASIAAASVIAKVERDAIMRAAHVEHPHFGWEGNKGYGAEAHLDAIREHGPSDWHRVSWKLPEREPSS
ncbi:ribonuclease HII [Demequina lutea]|uniref:Ribonuclease n=1 Tax=Demequina lutea TaxID=431489 RepID=A0A7Z0CKF8_9MICO|nr:ribonuclease HII [Demequina lutea]NYI41863.1 ribonuclease HII [Demequina lutea]